MPRKKRPDINNRGSRRTIQQRILRAKAKRLREQSSQTVEYLKRGPKPKVRSEEEIAQMRERQRIRKKERRAQESQEQRDERRLKDLLRARAARRKDIEKYRARDRERQRMRRALKRANLMASMRGNEAFLESNSGCLEQDSQTEPVSKCGSTERLENFIRPENIKFEIDIGETVLYDENTCKQEIKEELLEEDNNVQNNIYDYQACIVKKEFDPDTTLSEQIEDDIKSIMEQEYNNTTEDYKCNLVESKLNINEEFGLFKEENQ